MLRTPLRFAVFALLVILTGMMLIAVPVRSAELPPIHYVAAPFIPYTNTTSDGRALGPTAQLIEALGLRLQRSGTLDVLPFARALATAENEPNTLIALIARTPEREARFHWICPVLDYEVAVFRRRNHAGVTARTVADLKRWRIAGVPQDVKTLYLERNGIVVIPAADENEAVRLLVYGRVDAIASHPAGIRQRVRDLAERGDAVENLLPLPDLSMKLYLAFGAKTAPAVAETVTAACSEMTRSGQITRLLQAPQLY
jgi:polar amino acid transport system substrate-binding protein